MLQQMSHRSIHHISKRLGMNTHIESRCSQQGQNQKLSSTNIFQALDIFISRRTKINALEHPKAISGTPYQCCGSDQTSPKIELYCSQNHHPLTDKTCSTRKATISHEKEQGKSSKLWHRINNTTVSSYFTRVDTIVENTNAQEHCTRDKS